MHQIRTRDFNYTRIKSFLLNASESRSIGRVRVDSIGMQSKSLSNVLLDLASDNRLGAIEARSLILKEGSEGAISRAYLEGRSIGKINSSCNNAKESWLEVESVFQDPLGKSVINIKLFDMNPLLYIVRVDNNMIVSPYVAQKGYDSWCFFIDGEKDKGAFNQYLGYFDKVFNWTEHTEDVHEPKSKPTITQYQKKSKSITNNEKEAATVKLVVEAAIACLNDGNFVGFFERMDEIVPDEKGTVFATLKDQFVNNKHPDMFDQRLKMFAINVEKIYSKYEQ